MASNLSSIGFAFTGADAFQDAMLRLARDAIERVDCSAGDYSIWRSRTGAEIWFHLPPFGTEDDARDIAGLTPFFEGTSEVAVEITECITRPGDNEFEGAFLARLVLDDGAADQYSLVFDAVDFAVHAERELPLRAHARLTGFAQSVRAFADEAGFAAADAGGHGIRLGPQAFVPVGQFANIEDDAAPRTSEVLLTGRVVEHRKLVNEVTSTPFHWLLVGSVGATFDVVADPECVRCDIVEDGIVEVRCMLFGRLLEG